MRKYHYNSTHIYLTWFCAAASSLPLTSSNLAEDDLLLSQVLHDQPQVRDQRQVHGGRQGQVQARHQGTGAHQEGEKGPQKSTVLRVANLLVKKANFMPGLRE